MATNLAIPQQLVGTEIERALIDGDLKQLTPTERISYYRAICASLGLNPLTKPFGYIVLNGKLTLYALKDCTEQLRKIRKVSITSVTPQQIGDLYVVVASGKDLDDRTDSATGAVTIANLKGENLANAMMKAETKAKRRLTLSLCGLGMLDETEVQTLKEQGAAHEEPTPQSPPSNVLTSQLQASLKEEVPTTSASTDDGTWMLIADQLTCIAIAVEDKVSAKKQPFVAVTWNGKIDGLNWGSCFDTKLFDALHASSGLECQLVLKKNAKANGDFYFSIPDVLSVNGIPYKDGQPVPQEQ